MQYRIICHLFFMQNELFIIDSPCIGVCTMNKKGYCAGCLRTRAERQTWHSLSDNDKVRIIKVLVRRKRNAKGILQQKNRRAFTNYELDFYRQGEQLTFEF